MPENATQTNQATRALLQLRQLLLDGEFPVGFRMSELPLVERLGVSRTPLRHALARLAHEGLLETLPAGGYAVRGFSASDVADAIELRGVLEGTAARVAAERGVAPAELAAMSALNDELGSVVRDRSFPAFERYLQLNEQFHEHLAALARSPMIERALEQASALPFASPNAFVLAEAELPASREILLIAHVQHCEIVNAIERREGTRAEGLCRDHARLAERNLEVVLADRSLLAAVPGAALLRLVD